MRPLNRAGTTINTSGMAQKCRIDIAPYVPACVNGIVAVDATKGT
jgi:hypothetical protein